MFRRAGGRGFRATVLSLAVAASLVGCSQPGPSVYGNVDAVAQQLDLRTAGQVMYTGTYGTGGSSDGPPTEVLVFNGTWASLTVEARMRNLGYAAPKAADGWWLPSPQSPVGVRVRDLPAGATYHVGPHATKAVERHATEVSIQERGVQAATSAPSAKATS